ncbi:MAG: iron complex transport system substrate-binding protein [Thermovirga sp.]|nr:iron complex transport system substrate-binding protein [Thermovirga sp.]
MWKDKTHKSPPIIFFLAVVLVFVGWLAADSAEADEGINRIVSLAPSVTESLELLGYTSKIAGVTSYDPLREKGNVDSVGGFSNPSLEKIMSLDPDLVIGVSTFHHEILERIKAFGVRALEIEPHRRLMEVEKSFYRIGDALGCLRKAEETWHNVVVKLDKIKALVKETFPEGSPSVLIVVWHDPLTVVGGYNYIDDILDWIGIRNAAEAIKFTFPNIDRERLLLMDPDAILIASAETGMSMGVQDFLSEFGKLPIDAIKKGKVALVKSDLLFHPGPKAPETAMLVLEAMANLYGKKVKK